MNKRKIVEYSHALLLVSYNKETGIFTWMRRHGNDRGSRVFNSQFAGKQCGCDDGKGYVKIGFMLNGKRVHVHAHRLAWLCVHGEIPYGDIDHINGNPSDNRIDNIRNVTRSINQRNARMQSNNSSGMTGVIWHSQHKKWMAQATVIGKKHHLGYFHDKNEAHQAVLAFRLKNGFTDRHGKDRNQSA